MKLKNFVSLPFLLFCVPSLLAFGNGGHYAIGRSISGATSLPAECTMIPSFWTAPNVVAAIHLVDIVNGQQQDVPSWRLYNARTGNTGILILARCFAAHQRADAALATLSADDRNFFVGKAEEVGQFLLPNTRNTLTSPPVAMTLTPGEAAAISRALGTQESAAQIQQRINAGLSDAASKIEEGFRSGAQALFNGGAALRNLLVDAARRAESVMNDFR